MWHTTFVRSRSTLYCWQRQLQVISHRNTFAPSITARISTTAPKCQTTSSDATSPAAVSSSSSSSEPSPPVAEYTFKYPKSKQVFDKMVKLQIEEIKLLSELINEKLGITITEADMRGFGSGDGLGQNEADDATETVAKTAFDLKLTGFDDKSKIKIIKEVRAITGLGLKEAKDMVEGAPKILKKQIKMEEAEELKAKLEAVGATVEID